MSECDIPTTDKIQKLIVILAQAKAVFKNDRDDVTLKNYEIEIYNTVILSITNTLIYIGKAIEDYKNAGEDFYV